MSSPVSIIIPTFNGKHLLEKHLPSVEAAARNGDEIVIIDDASKDTTAAWLIETYRLSPEGDSEYQGLIRKGKKNIVIRLLQNRKNLRFGASVNYAVEQCFNDVFLLLNNDVEPKADVLTYLLPHFERHDVFAVGCLEYESHEHINASGKSELWFERGLFQHRKADTVHMGKTAWVAGGSGLFSRKKWQELGGFDPIFYPAYWEDIDISHRARKKGWRVLFEPKAIVYHLHESTNKPVFGDNSMIKMSWKNADTFTWKHANYWQKVQYLLWRPFWLLKRHQATINT